MQLDTMQDPDASAHAGDNGAAAHPEDDEVVTALRKQIAARKVRVDELYAQLATLEPGLKRCERALALLTDQPAPMGRPPKYRQEGDAPTPQRRKSAGVSPEVLEKVAQAIREVAQDHDEFRQLDIRTTATDPQLHRSGTIALAFEHLRQSGMIRLARRSGNNKFYRLTTRELQA